MKIFKLSALNKTTGMKSWEVIAGNHPAGQIFHKDNDGNITTIVVGGKHGTLKYQILFSPQDLNHLLEETR
jgi:hypothetical protein